MVIADYGYDSEKGCTCYKIIHCECGKMEVVEKEDKYYCKSCGRLRDDSTRSN